MFALLEYVYRTSKRNTLRPSNNIKSYLRTMTTYFKLLFLSLIVTGNLYSQNLDSLKKATENTELSDSLRFDAYKQLVRKDTSSLRNTYFNAVDFAIGQNRYDWVSELYSLRSDQIGDENLLHNLHLKNKAIVYAKKAGDRASVASAYIRKALFLNGNIASEKAAESIEQGLKVARQINDSSKLEWALKMCGYVNLHAGNYERSRDCYGERARVLLALGDTIAASDAIGWQGNAMSFVDPKQAIEYRLQSMRMLNSFENRDTVPDRVWANVAQNYRYLAGFFSADGQLDSALKYFNKSRFIYKQMNNTMRYKNTLMETASVYVKLKEYRKALTLLDSFLVKGQFDGWYMTPIGTRLAAICNAKLGNTEDAVYFMEWHLQLRDSLDNMNQSSVLTQAEAQSQFDQEEARLKMIHNHESKLAEAQLDKQKNLTYLLGGGILLVVLFGGVVYKSYRDKKRDNKVIQEQKARVEHQRLMLEVRNNEITDSISYAKRIQEAILPSHEVVRKLLPNSFVLYKPKDIVAGDFYWVEKQDDWIFFAAADCTGHGVPGAMVSVVCHNALVRAIKEFNLTDPGKILDKVREIVIDTFKQSNDVKDGMDISLCGLNPMTNELLYAGANNPLWIINDASNLVKEAHTDPSAAIYPVGDEMDCKMKLVEFKPDKQPIGVYARAMPFSTHKIQLMPGAMLYIFSDGYADQFGGPRGKKFKYKAFKDLVLSIVDKPIETQQIELEKAFSSWKGEMEQVDDICVIGVRI